jgi:hypothetical protein
MAEQVKKTSSGQKRSSTRTNERERNKKRIVERERENGREKKEE